MGVGGVIVAFGVLCDITYCCGDEDVGWMSLTGG